MRGVKQVWTAVKETVMTATSAVALLREKKPTGRDSVANFSRTRAEVEAISAQTNAQRKHKGYGMRHAQALYLDQSTTGKCQRAAGVIVRVLLPANGGHETLARKPKHHRRYWEDGNGKTRHCCQNNTEQISHRWPGLATNYLLTVKLHAGVQAQRFTPSTPKLDPCVRAFP